MKWHLRKRITITEEAGRKYSVKSRHYQNNMDVLTQLMTTTCNAMLSTGFKKQDILTLIDMVATTLEKGRGVNREP